MATAAIGTAVSLGVSALSGALTPSKNIFNETQVGKLENVSTRKTGAGWSLGKVYGRVQIQGCPIFWAPERREEVVTTTESTRSGGTKFGGGQTTTNSTQTYKYFGNFAFAICDGAAEISVRQIKFNDKIWYNQDGQLDGTVADNDYKLENYLKIYTGASDQNIDPTIQSFEGNQNGDRNFRHLVYAVVTDFPLDEFGGELPSSIDVVVDRSNGTSNRIDQVIYEVAATVGLVAGVDIKCDNIDSQYPPVNAIFKQDGGTAADFINELVQRHFLLTYLDEDGAIVFNGPGEVVAAVDGNWGKLGAVEYGNEPGDPYSEIMPDESELPSSVTLSYSNLSDDFNGDNEIINYPIAKHYNPKTISSQLLLMPDEAKWWVWKYLNFAWDQARRFTINILPEDAVLLTEAFRYNIPLTEGGSNIPFQIASIVIGANLVGEVELYQFNGDVYTAQPKVSNQTNINYNGGVIQLAPNISDTPIIVSADGLTTYTPGVDYTVNSTTGEVTVLGGSISSGDDITVFYTAEADFTLNAYNPNTELQDFGEPVVTIVETNRIRVSDQPCVYASIARGATGFGQTTIYSRVNGGSYQVVGSALAPTTKGALSGTLAQASGLDTVNTATVVLTEGTLDPLDQNQFDNQEVILLIGSEQIVARDVTLTGTNTYQLSNIQRGVNGTIPASHVNAEPVYLAKGGIGSLLVLASDSSAIGNTFDFKAVPFNSDLATIVTVTNYTVLGLYFKPYAGINLFASQDQGDTIYLQWTSRDTGAELLNPQSFEIEVYDGVNIVRTLTTDKAFAVYSNDNQIADFGNTLSSISVVIYQVSREFGRGYLFSQTITPTPTIILPFVADFSPRSARLGDVVVLYGLAFTGATSAAINGVDLTFFSVIDDKTAVGIVDIGTTDGKVSITNSVGTAESVAEFTILPPTTFADITGAVSGNSELWDYIIRSLRYTQTTADFTIPDIGDTVTVGVADPSYYVATAPVFVGSPGVGYAQLIVDSKTANSITFTRNSLCLFDQTFFPSGAFLLPMIDASQVYNFNGVSNDINVPFSNLLGFARDNADLNSELDDKEDVILAGTVSDYWRGDKTFQTLDKNAVGLGNVNNTSDLNKPISTATQSALDDKFNNPTGNTNQYIRGDGSLATLPTSSTETFGSVYIAAPTNGLIIKIPAGVGYTINELKGVAVDTGTCTLAVKINGVAVTGLSAIAVTTTPQNINASGANIMAEGGLLTWEFSNVSGATGFRGSLSVSI